jgi:SAM-dependent methyltransferase
MTEDPKTIRESQRRDWGAAAEGWSRERRARGGTAPVTEQLIEMAGIGPGDRVLDLACGAGDPAFAIAEVVAGGHVLGLDLSEPMLVAARARAEEMNVRNVEFRVIQSELELGVPGDSFDAAVCRFGLMFMPDPLAVMRTVASAVRPGGRVAVATWGPLERVPMIAVDLAILGRHLHVPEPDPRAPGPNALPSPDILRDVFNEAGLEDVEVVILDVDGALEGPDPATYWDGHVSSSGRLMAVMEPLTDDLRREIRDDAIRTYSRMFPEGPVRMGGEALVAAGVKPD